MGCNCGGGGVNGFRGGSGSVPFYLSEHPIASLLQTVQRFIGAPPSGMWDQATHDAFNAFYVRSVVPLYAGAMSSRPPLGEWGSLPNAGSVLLELVNPHGSEAATTFVLPLRTDLGLEPQPTDRATRSIIEEQALAVARYVSGVEAGTIDPIKSGAEAATTPSRSGGGSAVLVILAVAAVGVTLWAISGKKEQQR